MNSRNPSGFRVDQTDQVKNSHGPHQQSLRRFKGLWNIVIIQRAQYKASSRTASSTFCIAATPRAAVVISFQPIWDSPRGAPLRTSHSRSSQPTSIEGRTPQRLPSYKFVRLSFLSSYLGNGWRSYSETKSFLMIASSMSFRFPIGGGSGRVCRIFSNAVMRRAKYDALYPLWWLLQLKISDIKVCPVLEIASSNLLGESVKKNQWSDEIR